MHEVEIGRRDEAVLEHAGADPVEQRSPVGAVAEHHRKAADLARLDQCQRLEQLVERAEAAGENHESVGRLHEHGLAGVEVLERQREIAVRIEALFLRELDAEPDGQAAGLLAATIGSLHHARSPTRDDREPGLRKEAGRLACGSVGGRLLADPRRAEDRHGRPVDLLHLLEAREKLRGDQRHVAGECLVTAAQQPAIELAAVHRRSCGMWAATMPRASPAATATEMTPTTPASRRASAGLGRPPPARRTRHERRR